MVAEKGELSRFCPYPQEIIPLMDVVANEYYVEKLLPEDEDAFTRIQVRRYTG